MKTKLKLTAICFCILHSSFCLRVQGQGALTPPGAPAPTMKSLAQIEPRTPISAAPFTISAAGSYYLTTNLNVSSGDAIIITANDVTLDLSGFTLRSTANPAAGYGIKLGASSAVTNIIIANGHISGSVTNNGSTYGGAGFASGIYYASGSPCCVRVREVSVFGCQSMGINLGLNSTAVQGCVVRTVASEGILATMVSDSIADNCGTRGVYANTANNCIGSSPGGTGVEVVGLATSCTGTSGGVGLAAYIANACRATGSVQFIVTHNVNSF